MDTRAHLQRRLGPDHPNTLAAIEWIDYMASPTERISYSEQFICLCRDAYAAEPE